MKTIIHDMPAGTFKNGEEQLVIGPGDPFLRCIGCFGCWVKTPAVCVLPDKYRHMPAVLKQSDELVLVSRCTYGGYSPFIKGALDRSIGYLLPYFRICNNEMHHRLRYKKELHISSYFYGAVNEQEAETAKGVAAGNAVNFNAGIHRVRFFDSSEELLREAGL